MSINRKLGRCGIFCGQCRSYTSTLADMASKFKEYVLQDFQWLKETEDTFDYDNFLIGLEWFTSSTCPGCRDSKEIWCDVKKCEKIVNNIIDNCLLCDEFSECPLTDYQRNRYSYLHEHIEFIQKEGFEKYLVREENKAKDGVCIQEIRDY